MPDLQLSFGDAGWSSPVARQAHNLKVASSNLAPATKSSFQVGDLEGFFCAIAARMRGDEVCADLSPFDTVTRTHVASSLLEKTRRAQSSLDDLRQAANNALRRPPTMWR